MEKFIEEFDNYTAFFDMNNPLIRSRYHHSYRVMDYAVKLSNLLGLDDNDTYIASIIGLLHDVGRFEQIKQYNTIDDSKSIDHAKYSVEYLFDNKNISKYVVDESIYSIIKKAINYHNKFSLPHRGLTKKERLHAKIIRDVDKIDILYLIGVLKENELRYDSKLPISKSVIDAFYSGRLLSHSDIKNDNERILYHLAYVFDLNFRESAKIILSLHLLPIFFKNLGSPDELGPYFNFAFNYLNGR